MGELPPYAMSLFFNWKMDFERNYFRKISFLVELSNLNSIFYIKSLNALSKRLQSIAGRTRPAHCQQPAIHSLQVDSWSSCYSKNGCNTSVKLGILACNPWKQWTSFQVHVWLISTQHFRTSSNEHVLHGWLLFCPRQCIWLLWIVTFDSGNSQSGHGNWNSSIHCQS